MKVVKNNFHYVAKTLHGLEEILERELIGLGARNTRILNQAVSFDGDKALMYAANFRCRTALQIMRHITSFSFNSENEYFKILTEVRWEQYIKPEQSIMVQASTNSSYQGQNRNIELKTKDAIMERFRSIYSQKPAYSSNNPDLHIIIYIEDDICMVSANSSGLPLNMRGYRVTNAGPQLNEVLAAGMVLLSGWDQKSDFFDPLCGAGTLLIEAAMIANNIPAGTYRDDWAFKRWKDFDKNLLQKVMEEGFNDQSEADIQIIGSDPSEQNIEIALENLRRAKLHKDIFLSHAALDELDPEIDKPGVVMASLAGITTDEVDDHSSSLYAQIGDQLKTKFDGFSLCLLSTDQNALAEVDLKRLKQQVLNLGHTEYHLFKYQLSEDSVKEASSSAEEMN